MNTRSVGLSIGNLRRIGFVFLFLLGSSVLRAGALAVGSFNLKRLGHDRDKDLSRVSFLIRESQADVVALTEVMTRQGAEDLLKTLRETSGDMAWDMVVSPVATGGRYKEFFAFLYRTDVLSPFAPSLGNACGEESEEASCFLPEKIDHHSLERTPFLSHFLWNQELLVLIATHIFYGDQSQKSFHKRQKEALALRSAFLKIEALPVPRRMTDRDVFIVGDFNLAVPPRQSESGASLKDYLPDLFFTPSSPLRVLLSTPTTIGGKNFDHVIMSKDSSLRVVSENVIQDFDPDSKDARKQYLDRVSDHFPVSVTLESSADR